MLKIAHTTQIRIDVPCTRAILVNIVWYTEVFICSEVMLSEIIDIENNIYNSDK